MRWTRALAAHVPITAIALVGLFAVGVGLQGLRADESSQGRRLLVRVNAEHVDELAAWVAQRGGRVVDLDTLEAVGSPPTREGPSQPAPRALVSARAAYERLLAALRETEPAERSWQVGHVHVTQDKLDVMLVAKEVELLDRLRAAVGASLGGEHGAAAELGSVVKDGSWLRAHLSASWEPTREAPRVSPAASLDVARRRLVAVHELAAVAGLHLERASAERVDARSDFDLGLLGREFVFQAASRDAMVAYMSKLESDVEGLVVTELSRRDSVVGEKPQEHAWSMRVALTFQHP